MKLGRVFILGDSYSTFDGYIPQGYAPYYGEWENPTDVRAAEQTWWHLLVKETNSELCSDPFRTQGKQKKTKITAFWEAPERREHKTDDP